jgi:hypothetical protein
VVFIFRGIGIPAFYFALEMVNRWAEARPKPYRVGKYPQSPEEATLQKNIVCRSFSRDI